MKRERNKIINNSFYLEKIFKNINLEYKYKIVN